MTRKLTTADYRTLAAFRRELRSFLRFSESAARGEGLTAAQHQLLLAIRGHPADTRPSPSDIAEALQVKLNSAVELVNRAEANGLLVRHSDPQDYRRTLLELTEVGQHHLERLSAVHRSELSRFRTDMIHLLDSLET